MVEAAADGERSQALSDALRDIEAQAKADRAAIVALERIAHEPVNLPTPEAVMRRVSETITLFEQNPAAARERLRAKIGDEGIRLEISPEGHYVGRTSVFPLIAMAQTNNAEPLFKDSALFEDGSGDRI